MINEKLFEEVRLRMGATKKERLARAAERSAEFNARAAKDFEAQRMTPELLSKRCTL
jgi:hypothetical protein